MVQQVVTGHSAGAMQVDHEADAADMQARADLLSSVPLLTPEAAADLAIGGLMCAPHGRRCMLPVCRCLCAAACAPLPACRCLCAAAHLLWCPACYPTRLLPCAGFEPGVCPRLTRRVAFEPGQARAADDGRDFRRAAGGWGR